MKEFKHSLFHFLNKTAAGRALINTRFVLLHGNSAGYWEKRYRRNGNSGSGSYGKLAEYKATVINGFVAANNIQQVMEFGCGDGNQLKQFHFPFYTGLDVSATAIERCARLFEGDHTKEFLIYNAASWGQADYRQAELVLSLDVLYHLVEDRVYEQYLHHLFSASRCFVIIYAWDTGQQQSFHVRHRKFTPWVATHFKNWQLVQQVSNKDIPEACDFFVYEKIA